MPSKLFNQRLIVTLILGFASGLPLALTGTALQAWLTVDNVDVKTIGFFTLVGMPYTFKFLWAPLMDRFELPFLGRRRGWLVLTQLGLAGALFLISLFSPQQQTQLFALIAVLISFLSASQDVVIDAYRTDILLPEERGLGSSLTVFGYRLAMILSGGIAFTWADVVSGKGWNWSHIYNIMAVIMLILALVSLFFLPRVSQNNKAPGSKAKNDLIGFVAVVAAVIVGYQVTQYVFAPLAIKLFSFFSIAPDDSTSVSEIKKWADLISLMAGLGFTLPLAWWSAKKAKFETLVTSLTNFFSMQGALSFLALIILYKLGDSFTGSLLTTFLIKGVGFSQAEIGVINKVIGLWLTIVGAILGGAIMIRIRLYRALLVFGVLQFVSNFGFWLVSVLGKDAWGAFTLPAFDIAIITLNEATKVDWLLLITVGIENISAGMGTAAFVAFLMALCNHKFSATQYALLSAFAAVGRVWVGPLAGTLVESIGWSKFIFITSFAAIPGLVLIYKMRVTLQELEVKK